jgi:hypothetical protein
MLIRTLQQIVKFENGDIHLEYITYWPFISAFPKKVGLTQWISLLYRRLQKIQQIKSDHCDRYQNDRIKKCI